MSKPAPTYITSLAPTDLEAALGSRARVGPALRAIYEHAAGGRLPDAAEGVAGEAWRGLVGRYGLPPFRVVERLRSTDGTLRLLTEIAGSAVETVLIPGSARTTVCVSSQSGCTRACRFCATGRLGFERNLQAGEIVLQVMLAGAEAESAGLLAPGNVVFMGMGEPLDNLDEVVRAVEVLTAWPAPALAPRRITVSTSGVLPAIRPFLARSPAELALSLHATTDEVRDELVPHNRSWPTKDVLDEIKDALDGDGRLLFVEYLLLSGVNDSVEDARRLGALLEGTPCRVNLIPFNAVEGLPFEEPSDESVGRFLSELSRAGLRTMLRRPRGRDVAAACGQLAAGRDRD